MIGKRALPVPLGTSLLLDLAPHGGCLAGDIAVPAGGLLHHLFTLTHPIGERYAFCGPVPNVYTLPGVTRHAALWCADFPRIRRTRVHPADLVHFEYVFIIRLRHMICVGLVANEVGLHFFDKLIKKFFVSNLGVFSGPNHIRLSTWRLAMIIVFDAGQS
jgi:hypothetical protein